MIIYNLGRLYRARGINNPSSFLRKNGISNGTAGKLSKDRVTGIHTSVMEKLCEILYCTPNELMEWVPDKNSNLPSGHPLHSISKRTDVNMANILKSVPIEAMERIQEFIENETGNLVSEAASLGTEKKHKDESGKKVSGKTNTDAGKKAGQKTNKGTGSKSGKKSDRVS